MTRYIEKLNRVYAIQNNENYVDDIIPFLRKHDINFEYKENFLEGRHIDVNVHGEYITFNFGDYLVVDTAGVYMMSFKEFKNEFEEDIDFEKLIFDLEGKLSKALYGVRPAEIDDLKNNHQS